jgi:hypothetical protein
VIAIQGIGDAPNMYTVTAGTVAPGSSGLPPFFRKGSTRVASEVSDKSLFHSAGAPGRGGTTAVAEDRIEHS